MSNCSNYSNKIPITKSQKIWKFGHWSFFRLIRLIIVILLFSFLFLIYNSPVEAAFSKGYLRAAYNSQENKFFLVWIDGRHSTGGIECYRSAGCNQDIYGTFLNSSSQLGQELPLAVEQNEQEFPDVAYNSQQNEYLLVYQRLDGDFNIYAKRLGGNGQVLSSIAVYTETGDQWEPSVAYDNVNNRYLVIFMGHFPEADGKEVKAQLLDGNGEKSGPLKTLSLENGTQVAPGKQERPVAVFSPEEQKYIVVWEDEGRAGGSGTVLDKDGNILLNPKNFFFTQGGDRVIYPQIGYSSFDRKATVVWQEGINETKKIKVVRISTGGEKTTPETILESSVSAGNPRPGIACDPANGSCLTGWFNWQAYAGRLQFVDKNGQKNGGFIEGIGYRPSITFNPTDRYFLVVKSDNPASFKKISALNSPSTSPIPPTQTPTPNLSPTATGSPSGSPSPSVPPIPVTSATLNFQVNFEGAPNEQPFIVSLLAKGTDFIQKILIYGNRAFNNLSLPGLVTDQTYEFILSSFPFLNLKKSVNLQTGVNPDSNTALNFGVLKTGDLNGDNAINGLDWSIMKGNFGESGEE